jgi:hypothetical protein
MVLSVRDSPPRKGKSPACSLTRNPPALSPSEPFDKLSGAWAGPDPRRVRKITISGAGSALQAPHRDFDLERQHFEGGWLQRVSVLSPGSAFCKIDAATRCRGSIRGYRRRVGQHLHLLCHCGEFQRGREPPFDACIRHGPQSIDSIRPNRLLKIQNAVIPRHAACRGIPLFFDLNHRGIPRCARNDALSDFFRSLLNCSDIIAGHLYLWTESEGGSDRVKYTYASSPHCARY